jgi:hypothetical protein
MLSNFVARFEGFVGADDHVFSPVIRDRLKEPEFLFPGFAISGVPLKFEVFLIRLGGLVGRLV